MTSAMEEGEKITEKDIKSEREGGGGNHLAASFARFVLSPPLTPPWTLSSSLSRLSARITQAVLGDY